MFGLDLDVMHYMINTIGERVQKGQKFEVGEMYSDLIDAYQCTVRTVNLRWHEHFMGFASWFYEGDNYQVFQCFWPDFEGHYPWEPDFDRELMWAQPLLFYEDAVNARAESLILD